MGLIVATASCNIPSLTLSYDSSEYGARCGEELLVVVIDIASIGRNSEFKAKGWMAFFI